MVDTVKISELAAAQGIGWASSFNLHRASADILAQRRGTNAQEYHLYNTFTDASNYERGFLKWSANVLEIGTANAGTGANRALTVKPRGNLLLESELGSVAFRTGGASRWTIDTAGNLDASVDNSVDIGASGANRPRDVYVGTGVQVAGGTKLNKLLSTTATLDFGSIAAQDTADLTVTLTGAATGDAVAIGPPSGLEADIVVFGFVSAADTVTVRAANPTGASIDPASATYRVTVFGF